MEDTRMKFHSRLLVYVCFGIAVCATAQAAPEVPMYVTNAVADPARPQDDRAQDANRKPEEVLAFTAVKPGQHIVDLMPGSGYFTRIFSKIVGAKGKVYALQPVEMDKEAPKGLQSLNSFAGTPAYANVVVLVQPVAALKLPEEVDAVWTSQNYHDLHDPFLGSPDMTHFNKSIFESLKPGGLFIVLDHVAAAGSGFSNTNDLHRIDPAAVKTEVMAAGFEFVGQSTVLANAQDDHSLPAFDKSIRGRTDKFIYKFRKPLH
jgi:predicted methyltransferase